MNKVNQIITSKLSGKESAAKTEISIYETTGFLRPGIVQSTLLEMNQKTRLNLPESLMAIKKYLENQT